MSFQDTLAFANSEDRKDPLKSFRRSFHIPKQPNGKNHLYFCGNSLGLQPKTTKSFLQQELNDWKAYGLKVIFIVKILGYPITNF